MKNIEILKNKKMNYVNLLLLKMINKIKNIVLSRGKRVNSKYSFLFTVDLNFNNINKIDKHIELGYNNNFLTNPLKALLIYEF